MMAVHMLFLSCFFPWRVAQIFVVLHHLTFSIGFCGRRRLIRLSVSKQQVIDLSVPREMESIYDSYLWNFNQIISVTMRICIFTGLRICCFNLNEAFQTCDMFGLALTCTWVVVDEALVDAGQLLCADVAGGIGRGLEIQVVLALNEKFRRSHIHPNHHFVGEAGFFYGRLDQVQRCVGTVEGQLKDTQQEV